MHLVIVPCHAVYMGGGGGQAAAAWDDPSQWVLMPFQVGEQGAFREHLETAARLAAADATAVLVLTGGQTRREAGPLAEATSYFLLGQRLGLLTGVEGRVLTETFARDSMENLAFALTRCEQFRGGTHPARITVVGWEFKRRRFEHHTRSLGLDMAHFAYVGCGTPADEGGALRGEAKTLELFRQCPMGNAGLLSEKRRGRDPFCNGVPYQSSWADAVRDLPSSQDKPPPAEAE